MRLFCLNFHRTVSPSISEAFLRFTPQLFFREPGLLWGDITHTWSRFGSSQELTTSLRRICEELGQEQTSVALGESLAGTQLLSYNFDCFTAPLGTEHEAWEHLPINHLRFFEGREPWPQEIHALIGELEELGYQNLRDLKKISYSH